MLGTLLNAAGVALGASIGLLLRRGIPKELEEKIFDAVGLFTAALGIVMSCSIERPVATVLGLLAGSILGSFLKIEENLSKIGSIIKKEDTGAFTQGLLTAFMTYCVGPMTIIGSIEDGLGDPSIILAKAVMDTTVSIAYAAAMGYGVLFSSILLLAFQGSLALAASFLKPYLSTATLHDITGVGGILLIGLALNLLKVRKIKVGDMLPSLITVPLLSAIIKT